MKQDSNTDSAEFDPREVQNLVDRIGGKREHLVPLLQAVQEQYHYLPGPVLRMLCEMTVITPADMAGVSTFFPRFRHHPAGEHTIRVCMGTACHVKGAERVLDAIYRHLKLRPGQDTDENRLFTVDQVACLGCCTLAPVVQIDQVTYGHVTPSRVPHILKDFLSRRRESAAAQKSRPVSRPAGTEIRIGLGSCCQASGSGAVFRAIKDTLTELEISVPVKPVGCVGMCHQTPLVEIAFPDRPPVLYARVRDQDIRQIIHNHFSPEHPVLKIRHLASQWLEDLYTNETWEPVTRYAIDIRDRPVAAFLDRQKHITTEHYGVIDPFSLDEYKTREGFTAARHCFLNLDPEQIIDVIKSSGLRGRGGAGFPTGRKWKAVLQAKGRSRHIICNCDEGDPGAFMDRMLLESYP